MWCKTIRHQVTLGRFKVKRALQILSASVVSVSMMAGVAAADATSSTCTISNTGNGSVNSCTNIDANTTTIFCTNDAKITNDNFQVGEGGTVTVESNSSAGSATTGDVHNTALNEVAAQLGCGTVAVATTAPTTPVTPAVGGQGAGTPAATPTPAPAATPVASLPDTGSNTALNTGIAGVAVVGGLMAVAQLSVSAYRRFALK